MPATLRALMCSTSAPGKLFSIPNRTPIFFMESPEAKRRPRLPRHLTTVYGSAGRRHASRLVCRQRSGGANGLPGFDSGPGVWERRRKDRKDNCKGGELESAGERLDAG